MRPTSTPVTVTFPNGETIQSIKEGYLNLPHLTRPERLVHIFADEDLSEFSLLSIGQLCDGDCTAHYDKDRVWITDNKTGNTFIQGARDSDTGLYMISLDTMPPGDGSHVPSTSHTTHIAAPMTSAALRSAPVAQRVAYWSASMGGPVTDTLVRAMTKWGLSFPGTTLSDFKRYPPHFTETDKGHMHMQRRGIQPTNYAPASPAAATDEGMTDSIDPSAETEEDWSPVPPPSMGPGLPPHTLACATVQTKCIQLTQENFTDMAGRFPYQSFAGNQYLLIMYCADANYIHCEVMATRKGKEYARAYEQGIKFFQDRNITVTWERLDNETSQELTEVARKLHITIQYLPPHNHRASKAERAIQTWKNHFISVLCLTHPDFPMGAWDHLIEQTELTLNLLRGSRVNPALSAWAQLHGPLNLAKTPLAPAGTKVVIFETPSQRATWAPHGVNGFYVGPALQHYRCYRTLVTKTKRVRIAETLSWHPHQVTMPFSSTDDLLHAAILDLQTTIAEYNKTDRALTNAPQPAQHTQQLITQALRQMLNMFDSSTQEQGSSEHQTELCEELTQADTQGDASGGEHQNSFTTLPELTSSNREEGREMHPTTAISSTPAPEPATETRCETSAPGASEQVPVPAPRRSARSSPPPRLQPDTPKAPSRARRTGTRHRRKPPQYMAAAAIQDCLFTAMDMDEKGAKLRYESAMRSSEGAQWTAGAIKEFDRLVEETHTGSWIPRKNVPQGRKISYYNPRLTRKRRGPDRIEYRVRGTYGGDRGDYTGPTAAETADVTAVKIMLNAVISEPDACWLTTDISDFYLGTPMDSPEFMRVPLKYIPEATMTKYHLHDLVCNDAVIMRLDKGIYGLKQAGRLAQQRLIKHLETNGYTETSTPCIFHHATTGKIRIRFWRFDRNLKTFKDI